MTTQRQLCSHAEKRLFEQNEAFMDLVKHPTNPMTNQDLERLIARWPERYGRFAGFVGKLKEAPLLPAEMLADLERPCCGTFHGSPHRSTCAGTDSEGGCDDDL